MDVKKIFEYALQREYEGKRFFEENAGRLSHASAVGAFKTLAAEEQRHIEYIQAQLNAMGAGNPFDLEMGQKLAQKGFFSERADSEFIEQTVSEAMVPDLPVLRMAYLIEHDFAEFYEKSAKETEGEAKKVFELLAYWERNHEKLFKSLHDQAYERYSQMPWGG